MKTLYRNSGLISGPYDAIGEAKTGLTKLRMKDSTHITTYIMEFNAYATLLQWGDAEYMTHRKSHHLQAHL